MWRNADGMHAIIAWGKRTFRSREKREVDVGRGHEVNTVEVGCARETRHSRKPEYFVEDWMAAKKRVERGDMNRSE